METIKIKKVASFEGGPLIGTNLPPQRFAPVGGIVEEKFVLELFESSNENPYCKVRDAQKATHMLFGSTAKSFIEKAEISLDDLKSQELLYVVDSKKVGHWLTPEEATEAGVDPQSII